MVKKAVVLAAGLGTRLRPLTCVAPKPLMPVWGEPMLARIVAMLRSWGIDDIVVNCHYLNDQVEAWCKENGCRASFEPEILGTGGVLNPLRSWIGSDPVYLVNGDIVVEGIEGTRGKGSVGERMEECLRDKNVIASALVTEEGPRTIEVEPESGFVTNWKSDDAGYDGTFTYAGIALLKPEILDYIKPEGFSTIVAAYEKAMMEGKFVKTIAPAGMQWTDAGTIESYIDLNRDGNENAFADIPQLKALGGGEFEFLGARGSDRVFFRRGNEIIVIYDDEKRGENARYAGHAKWLKSKGASVPEVLVDRPEQKTLVLEFAGIEKKMTLDDYVKVVEALVKFNALGSEKDIPALEPAFGPDLWKWERDLFEQYCLGGMFGMAMTDEIRKEFESVAEKLEREPKALVHRDFQSTNVLWKNGALSFIDFQGMRLGPAVYDLASLVYDPYVELNEKTREALIALYAKASGRKDVIKIAPFAAVQRLCQCLGAYGRLASVGQPQFKKHVVPALQHLLAAADEAGLDAIGALAEDLLAQVEKAKHPEGCKCGECQG